MKPTPPQLPALRALISPRFPGFWRPGRCRLHPRWCGVPQSGAAERGFCWRERRIGIILNKTGIVFNHVEVIFLQPLCAAQISLKNGELSSLAARKSIPH